MGFIIDFILHIDKYLITMADNYGYFVYAILFMIIFSETGFVVTPFLPGDSVIFACGALAAIGGIDFISIFIILVLAAVLGNSVNYFIGKNFGIMLTNKLGDRFIKERHIKDTHLFFEKYGGSAIILSRFMPIIRTFAPFVAGLGDMNYRKFGLYNMVGGLLWVTLFLTVGFYFGNIPIIKENFSMVIMAIIAISLLPIIIKFMMGRKKEQD